MAIFDCNAVWERFPKGENDGTLLIELPEYKMPNARTIAIYVWEKVKDYLTKAGTTIFVASIVIWFILNFNMIWYGDRMSKIALELCWDTGWSRFLRRQDLGCGRLESL